MPVPSISEEIQRLETQYNPALNLLGSPETGGSIPSAARYAALLIQRGSSQDIARADMVVQALIALQVNDPQSRNHGQFPMRLDRPVGDLNAALFLMPSLVTLHAEATGKLPEATTRALGASLSHAIVAAERRWDEERFDVHRDYKCYTNIFLLYIQALLLAGNHLGDARLVRSATAQWQRWFNHVAYTGIDEFASPTYGDVDYHALKRIHAQSRDPQMQREARYILEHLCALQHAIAHPVLRLPVCGSSRSYRRFLTQAECDAQAVAEGADNAFASDAIRDDYRNRVFPYTVRGRATAVPFRYQSHQERHAALGTMSGGNYFWQQIHCMAAVGTSAADRAVLFMPGAYTPTNGYVCQQELTALCVFTREPNTFHRTQDLIPDNAVHAFQREFGIGMTGHWTVSDSVSGTMVATAFGYSVHLRPFEIANGAARAVVLPRVRQRDIGQGVFHSAPADFDALMFPATAVRFGCLVAVRPAGTAFTLPPVTVAEADGIQTVQSPLGLRVRLFQHPSGEITELYDDHWRTTPLFESRTQTLHPGDLARRALQPPAV